MSETLELKALVENFTKLLDWWHNVASSWNLASESINKIDICLEEIFVNVASYAYSDEPGMVSIFAEKSDSEISIKFEDAGIEYNPLQKEDPDITLSFEERPVGGLGIFMVKELSKSIEYERIDSKNVLTLKFKIE